MCDGAWKLQGPAHSGTLSGPRPSPSAPPPPGDSCCVLEGRAGQSKPEASCTVPFPLLQKLQSQHLAAFVGRSSWQGSQGQCALCARQGELLRPHRARGWVGPSGLPCVPGRLRLWVRGSPREGCYCSSLGAFQPAAAVPPAARASNVRPILALPSLPAGGCLHEVSSGPVLGPPSFCGPHLAGVCCDVGRACRLLPAPRGPYLPGCLCGSHATGRYLLRYLPPWENDSVGRTLFIGHLRRWSKGPTLVSITWATAACQSS